MRDAPLWRAAAATVSVPRPLKLPTGLSVSIFSVTEHPRSRLSGAHGSAGVSRKAGSVAPTAARTRSSRSRTRSRSLTPAGCHTRADTRYPEGQRPLWAKLGLVAGGGRAKWQDEAMALAVLTFAAAAALSILIPGPDNTLVVRNALRGGSRVGVGTAVGVLTGLLVWVAAAAAGLSVLLQASRIGYDMLRYVGAAYLLWLGVHSLRSGGKTSLTAEDKSGGRRAGGLGYLTGVATNLFNPKVGIFMITFLPAFITGGTCSRSIS